MRKTIHAPQKLDPNMVQSILKKAYGENVTVLWNDGLEVSFDDDYGLTDAVIYARIAGIADGMAFPGRAKLLQEIPKAQRQLSDYRHFFREIHLSEKGWSWLEGRAREFLEEEPAFAVSAEGL